MRAGLSHTLPAKAIQRMSIRTYLGPLTPRQWRDVGKRGQLLLTVGVMWMLSGVGNMVSEQPLAWANVAMLRDYPVGMAWFVTGAVAVFVAFRPVGIEHDGAGFLALYLMPAWFAAAFLVAWVDSLTPFVGSVGYPRGWIASIIYLAFVAVVMICSRWAEPLVVPPIVGGDAAP